MRNAAAAGHADIRAYSDRFTALASTAAVDARTNTATVASDAEVPIYWLSTTTTRAAVATGYADFYDGNWGDASARTESGTSTALDDSDASSVATGSNLDGTAATGGELGTSSVAGWWLSGGDLGSRPAPGSVSRRLLALSPVFEKDATTLVTNEGETPKSMQGAWWAAQGFTTGNHSEGYLLHAVWLDASAGSAYSAADTHVRIVPEKRDGTPQPVGNHLAELASPATIASGPDAFTAPPGTVLEPGTKYFVVVNRTIADWEARVKLVLTDSNDEQSGFGWEIGNTRRHHPEGDSAPIGGSPKSLSMRVTGREVTNNPPVFNPNTATREVEENTTTVTALGDPIPEATDADDDALTYTLEGTDAGSFTFDDTTRQISTKAGVDYNFEAKNRYTVEVKADDGNAGGTGTITVTIDVGDDPNEKTDRPDAPTVAATSGVSTSLDVSWVAPGVAGGPDITGFKLRYRKTAGTPPWTEVAGLAAADTVRTIGSLETGTEYEVQVQALNGEGDSDWSLSGTGSTSTPVPNRSPVFDPNTAMRTVRENASAGVAVGDPIAAATDDDGDALTYTLEGADAGSFAFDDTTRQISTKAGVDYNFEAKNRYTVEVKADDGNAGGTGTITVTIDVGDDPNEKTDTPGAPTVAATSGVNTSLDVSWVAPGLNGGPDITGFKLRYRKTAGTPPWTEVAGLAAADTVRTIGSLETGTEYEVQVQALNGEGDSDWSLSGTAKTGNNAPAFTPNTAMRTVAENTSAGVAVGDPIPEATDADDDALTYTLEGTDAGSFAFDASSRQISTGTGVSYNFEATKNSYEVVVKADDDKGGTGTITVTIDVGDDPNEKTDTPGAPTVAATSGVNTSLDVSWVAPGLNGGPDITGFKLRYRKTAGTPPWTEVAGLAAADTVRTIGSLESGTEYEVQVQALNGEGDSDWSLSGTAKTGNNAPAFTPNTAMRTVAENTSAGVAVGDPIPEATDADDDALTYTLEGTDAGSFAFDDTTRQISTKAGVDYNFEAKNRYTVEVKADDGNAGGTGTITVTIDVGDDPNEKTDTPGAPTVAATSGVNTSLDVSWVAPGLNGGPDITGFKLRYRKTAGTPPWTEVAGLAAADTVRTIGSLETGTEYEVQVQALNGEGDSDWSLSGDREDGEQRAGVHAEHGDAHGGGEHLGGRGGRGSDP